MARSRADVARPEVPMDTIGILAGIAAVHLLALVSPGPTFLVVTSHAMAGDRRAGFLVTAGVVLASVTWTILAAAGLGAVIATSPRVYAVLQLAGAAYLAWLGVKMLVGALRPAAAVPVSAATPKAGWRAVRAGYLTSISNPKVVAYYAALFGVMIPQDAPAWLFFGAAAMAIAISASWWSAITVFFALPPVRRGYARIRRAADVVMGVALVGIAGRLLATR
jgi:threonine efflux protein